MLVLINGDDVNGVYYWDHTRYFQESREGANTYKISDSFEDFINGLKVAS